jgi:hypothetical protein
MKEQSMRFMMRYSGLQLRLALRIRHYPCPYIQDRYGMKRFLVSKDEGDGKKARGTDETG